MTPEERDQTVDAYLWDPAAEPDAGVRALERSLASASFDPARSPLDLTALPARVIPRRAFAARPAVRVAIAASLLIAAAAGLYSWRWTWPEGRAWTLALEGSRVNLEVGQPVTVPGGTTADGNIARIGYLRAAAGSALELRATRATRHRLRVTQGDVHVRLWAPPGSLVVETPAGEVIDLGCEFVLSVDEDVTRVRVLSGWVQLENGIDETLVPEGASTDMPPDRSPGVPVFDDAAEGFREAVRAVEYERPAQQLDTAIRLARKRDVYTLLQLADRVVDWDAKTADALLRRAAELSPPPDGVTLASVMRGNRESLWKWANAQKLPPVKSGWWKNWRDALPFWVR